MTVEEIENMLRQYKIIAIVGLSDNKTKPSFEVAEYLKEQDYCIIPVNPFVPEVLGEKSYKSLLEVPPEIQKTIEVVDIFRRPEEVPPVVQQAITLHGRNGKPYLIWMQVGIVNYQAAEAARKAGLKVVMDKCLMVEHKKLGLNKA